MVMVPVMPPSALWTGAFLGSPGTKLRILRVAIEEWIRFGQQVVVGSRTPGRPTVSQRGHREGEPGYANIVGQYWQSIGLNYDGHDHDQYWSAAFISWVMKTAGVPESDFPRSRRHMTWIHFAIRNQLDGTPGAKMLGHRVDRYAPKVGDLVCYSRKRWLDYASAGRQAYGAAHSDIVVYAWSGEIGVIGGNVRNSVSLKRLPTDGNGVLADRTHDWFAVIENRLPWA